VNGILTRGGRVWRGERRGTPESECNTATVHFATPGFGYAGDSWPRPASLRQKRDRLVGLPHQVPKAHLQTKSPLTIDNLFFIPFAGI
jgi:hypothetical protein